MPIARQDLEHLLTQVMINAVGASEDGIKAAMYDAMFEFFRETQAWTENIPVTREADVADYKVVPADGGRVIGLAGVLDSNSIPVPANMPTFGTVHFRNAPSSADTVTATVVKNVQRPVGRDLIPDAPDWVLSIYYHVILAGILGKLMSQPDKSYSNTQLAALHMREFSDGISMASVDMLRRNTIGTQAWRFPSGGGSQRGGSSGDRSF